MASSGSGLLRVGDVGLRDHVALKRGRAWPAASKQTPRSHIAAARSWCGGGWCGELTKEIIDKVLPGEPPHRASGLSRSRFHQGSRSLERAGRGGGLLGRGRAPQAVFRRGGGHRLLVHLTKFTQQSPGQPGVGAGGERSGRRVRGHRAVRGADSTGVPAKTEEEETAGAETPQRGRPELNSGSAGRPAASRPPLLAFRAKTGRGEAKRRGGVVPFGGAQISP
jgi:hypothetical protein